jgi:hypothetical protein
MGNTNYQAGKAIRSTLRNAKQELIERGWTKGEYVDAEGRICLMEAVVRGARHHELPDWARADTMSFLSIQVMRRRTFKPKMEHILATWNDQPNRTQEEVISLIDDALTAHAEIANEE